jgi:amino acid transporter
MLSGSVGLSLIMWFVGMLIAAAGTAVYVEFGTGIPRNGGEKNILEYVFRTPKFLTTCMYAGYVVLLGWAAGNSVVFGEYILLAARVQPTQWNQRGLGLACITVAFLIHGTALKWGIRLQNFLGVIKLCIVLIIIIAPLVNLPKTTDNLSNAFEGTSGSAYGVVTSLNNVIWSYVGYSNANYALSETKNPVRTLKVAAPLAIGTVSVLYMLANISYFAGVPKEEILTSGRLVAASLFRNMFGERAERALSVFVALSAFGNVLSVIFSQGRLVQELGREGVLPFSRFWASNRPFNAPLPGLFAHWLVTSITIVAPPAGDAYNFVLKYDFLLSSLISLVTNHNVSLISYPLAIVNTFVAIGLIHLYLNRQEWRWNPPVKATLPVVIFFLLSNLFLVFAPYAPPEEGQNIYESMPYWTHNVVAWGVLAFGGVYWAIWVKLLPRIGGYRLERRIIVDDIDGWERNTFVKVPRDAPHVEDDSEGTFAT